MNNLKTYCINFTRGLQLLGTLKPSAGSTHPGKRVGRGASSGFGKTSGRGTKGQKARGKAKSIFEGGQTPIYKLFPKIGFRQPEQRQYTELSLDRISYFYKNGKLDEYLDNSKKLDMKEMYDIGMLTGIVKSGGVKIIGGKTKKIEDYENQLPTDLEIEVCKSSKTAIKALETNNCKIINRYFSELSLRAHLKPEWFLNKYNRIPLMSRPTKRKDIEYYTDYEHRGYLSQELVSGEKDTTFAQLIKDARESKANAALTTKSTTTSSSSSSSGSFAASRKKSGLELQIEKIKLQQQPLMTYEENSKIVSLKDLV